MNGVSGSWGCWLLGNCHYNGVSADIVWLYRAMNADPKNPDMPQLGTNAKSLGMRVPRDYKPGEDGLVYPQSTGGPGGLSTNLSSAEARQRGDLMRASDLWRINADDVPSGFLLSPDPDNANHIMWDVEEPLPAPAIESAIQSTQPLWQKVTEDPVGDL